MSPYLPPFHVGAWPSWARWALLGAAVLVALLILLAWWRPDWACLALAAILGLGGARVASRGTPPRTEEPSTDEVIDRVRAVQGASERVREAGAADGDTPSLERMREELDRAGVRRGEP